ncbi:MAG: AMP-binding protein [Hyphomicrobiales bacterium]
MILPDVRDYQFLREEFRWDLPERYNIARAVCDNWAEREPDRTALIYKHSDGSVENISYGRLRAEANQLANLLNRAGIGAGDRVAILLPQSMETVISHIAIYKLGAVAVPLAALFGVEALEYRLNNSGAKALVTAKASLPKITEICGRLETLQTIYSIDGAGELAEDLHSALAQESAEYETADTGINDPCLMIYTSGTTGPPKGALHGHRVLPGHLPGVQFSHEFLPQPGDKLWTPSDWAWAGGLLNVLLPGLFFGVPVVGQKSEKFDPEAAYALMEELSIRNVFIAPTAMKIMRMIENPSEKYDLNLRTLFSGGEAVGRELQDWALSNFGIPINEVFGQTECNLVLTSCAEIGVFRKGAIGKPVPGHEVAIVDNNGVQLPIGESGNIAVKRPDPVMFLEYWGKRNATVNKYAGDWLLTGDQGVQDEDGYFFFVGRDDDVITSAGYRIGPGEIEDCLIGHEAVKLAAVIGKPDPVRTEIVKAFIVLNEGFDETGNLADEITTYVRERLSAHEYPREIAFCESLPLTTTGKVIRRLLREEA